MTIILPSEDYFEENRLKTISNFKWAMKYNSEVEFEWKDKIYYITHPDGIINIHEEGGHLEAKEYSDANESLEYKVGNDRLRDIITKVKVWNRTV